MLSSEKLKYSAKESDWMTQLRRINFQSFKLPTFKASNTKGRSAKTESQELKMHVRLFLQVYISTQIRGGNTEEFFSHETLQYTPSLGKE